MSRDTAVENAAGQPPPIWRAPSPLPTSFQTQRLTLRFFGPDDAQSMLEGIEIDRASMLPWLPWAKTDNRNLNEVIFNIERFRRARESAAADDFVIGMIDTRTGEVVGGTGLHRIVAPWHEAEIGYWVRSDRRGRGFCTEAVAGLLTWAFRSQAEEGWGLRRVHIRCASENLASRRVPQKLGLRAEATLHGERWVEGHGWVNTLVWGVLSHEWDGAARRIRTES